MAEFPYTVVPAKLKAFLDQIPSTGVPDKLVVKELEARGYKSSNDRGILKVVRELGLVDEAGVPTEKWTQYRDRSRNRILLATTLRSAYPDLFATYPDAHERPEVDIRNFMSSKTRCSEGTVQHMVATFRMLCGLADFRAPATNDASGTADRAADDDRLLPVDVKTGGRTAARQIQVNLQIHIPDTADEKKIDSIFRSIARHLFGTEVPA